MPRIKLSEEEKQERLRLKEQKALEVAARKAERTRKAAEKAAEKARKAEMKNFCGEFKPFILNKLVPYFESIIFEIRPIIEQYIETKEISKENWNVLKKYVEALCDKYEEKPLLSFDKKIVEGVKYTTNHTTLYQIRTLDHCKYMLEHINTAMEYKNDEKMNRYYLSELYVAAEHLFFFIITKEK